MKIRIKIKGASSTCKLKTGRVRTGLCQDGFGAVLVLTKSGRYFRFNLLIVDDTIVKYACD